MSQAMQMQKKERKKVISISLSLKEDREITRLAKAAQQSKSRYLLDAFRREREREAVERIFLEGTRIGQSLGLFTDEDVVEWLEQTPRSLRFKR